MAETGWRRVDSFASGEVQALEYWDSITRSNNTITINGLRSKWRVTVAGSDSNVRTHTFFNGIERQYTHYGNPSWAAWNIRDGNQAWFSINVGANDTQAYTSTTWGDYSGSWNNGDRWFGIPALGAPSNIPTPVVVTRGKTSLAINTGSKTGATWGTNASADYLRIQWRKEGTSNWSQSSAMSSNMQNTAYTINSLEPNTSYEARTYCMNGGGKSNTGSIATMTTLSEIYNGGTVDIQAVTYSVIDAKARAGRYTNNNKIQYRKKGDTTWIDSDVVTGDTFSITISGLLPSTTYERRFVNTTTAGTTENGISEFTTLPAAKLVMPDGTVKNAIPRVVHPDGTVKMVKVIQA